MLGEPDDTFVMTSTDAAQALAAAVLTVGGRSCKAVMVTVESNPVKFAFGGATPVFGAGLLGHVVQKDAAPVFFVGTSMIATLKFVSAATGAAGKVQFTPFY
jgi:hypothetical protein